MRKSTIINAWKKSISPGELIDKASILLIKYYRVPMTFDARKKVWEEKEACWIALQSHVHSLPKKEWIRINNLLMCLHSELYLLNCTQWDYEDGVRGSEPEKYAVLARENNNKRVAKKNEINRLFGIGKELKRYKGEIKQEIDKQEIDKQEIDNEHNSTKESK